ncbi:hypothetical protein AB0H58_09600 [Nocardia neocaledoniensis]|uniref:Uncharacterized protein n=1 Tax=Nocardia neocaledoniensis TaxID=236511 RepID=A0A317NEB1_9NOCA|nr:hypothetical protein [Nocardia neocaledoniensis]PWV73495.1 hypothetical protein DFR69_107122 [Nocardia neocaledoniensis]GEM30054.1 hypothetical protein NN3_10610 [Nocardia neocaledoniensis NBRC 108232]
MLYYITENNSGSSGDGGILSLLLGLLSSSMSTGSAQTSGN